MNTHPHSTPQTGRPSPAIIGAVIAFSLTLLGASVAIVTGIVPLRAYSFAQKVDIGAVLLFVPLCALILAVLSEVVRLTIRGGSDSPIYATVAPAWTPGHGEG